MTEIDPRYQARLQPVLDHIRTSLDQPLRLEELAGKASFSSFHFHRVFKAVMGETLNAHVRRLRMERAHLLLTTSAYPRVIDIATACGYGSQSTFTRDFRRHFGITPGQLLRGKPVKPPLVTPGNPTAGGLGQSVTVETWPEMAVLSRTRFGRYGFRIGLAWIKLIVKARAKGLLSADSRKIGLIHDDPDITPAEKCRFDAAITVEHGAGDRLIPAGQYAVLDYQAGFIRLGETIDQLYADWLLNSGLYPGNGPLMMSFDGPIHDYRSFRLCLPVSPVP